MSSEKKSVSKKFLGLCLYFLIVNVAQCESWHSWGNINVKSGASEMDVFEANMSFDYFPTNEAGVLGRGPDGRNYMVYPMSVIGTGTIELMLSDRNIDQISECTEGSSSSLEGAFWSVVTPDFTGGIASKSYGGATYCEGTNSVCSSSGNVARRLDPEANTFYSSEFSGVAGGIIYVSDGPVGRYYPVSGQFPYGGNGQVYVYHSGDRPKFISFANYMKLDSRSNFCTISGVEMYEMPPIITPEPDTICDFWFDDDTLNLGVVDQKSAANANASARLNGLCNADASVNLRATPYDMKMGGLTIRMMFDDYDSNTKLNWNLSEARTESTPLWAVVTNVGNLIPNSYLKSGVVYIEYN